MLGEALAGQGRKGRWLAGQVGISESSISRLISGKQTVDEPVAKQIALILGTPFFVLFESVETDTMTVSALEASAA
jgi:transcriptional regulator with XRE-family HTH domain